MRIVIITANWPPSIWSGMGRLSKSLGAGLSERGHSVSVLTYTGAKQSRLVKDGNVLVRYISLNSQVEQPSALPLEKLGQWQSAVEDALNHQMANVDKVIIIDSTCWQAVKNAGKEKITVGILNSFYNIYGWITEINPVLKEKILVEEKSFCEEVPELLVNNEMLASKVEMFTGRRPRVYPIGVHSIGEVLHGENFRYKSHSNGEVLFVGKVSAEKGLERVIRALPELPWMKLKVVGPLTSWYQKSGIKNLCKKLEIDHQVEFLNWMNTKQVWDQYKKCEMVVVPSLFEKFGYGALDPMSAGIPVVASTANSLPEIIQDREDGMLFQNLGELKYALEEGHFMPPLREMFSQAAKEKIASTRTVSKMVDSISEVL